MDLSKFNTVFCDSEAALRAVMQDGLAGDCKVLTASPFLRSALGARAESLRDRMSASTLADILAVRPALQTRTLQAAAQARPEIQDYGESAALVLLTSLDQLILAACLTQSDCDEPRLVIRTKTGNARADRGCNGPWPALLAGNKKLLVKEVAAPAEGFDSTQNFSTGLIDRFRVAGWRRATFRAISSLGALWPSSAGREALILSENELLHETAFSLALRGWALRSVSLPGKSAHLSGGEASALEALCREVLAPYCDRWVIAPVRDCLITMITERVLSTAREQKAAAVAFEGLLAGLPPRPNRVMLSNFPAKASVLGPWHVARRNGIPLFGFQHGVSSEICHMQDATIATKEVMCSDRAYSFNERAAAVANAIPERRGVSVAVGMPGDMRRMKRARGPFSKRLATIGFVSTAVYSGYWNRLLYGTRTDAGMLDFELQMIREVLGGLRHDVLYKRYPSRRLLDPDPAMAAANAIPNIRTYSGSVDMRYLMGGCDVLVSARATSTLSWCLMSDKPFVYVDIHDDMRLRDDARPVFEKGLFLFSTAQAGWQAELRDFLDRPIADIQQEWRAKAEARRDLVRSYFDIGGPAGARAADDIAAFSNGINAGDLAVAAAP